MNHLNYPEALVAQAVQDFWDSRSGQAEKQKLSGTVDAGTRGTVTGGKHLDSLASLISKIFQDNEFSISDKTTLPGWYRRNKNWDIVATYRSELAGIVELKSQVGSIGNNANNRIEEMIGQAATSQRQQKRTSWVASQHGSATSWSSKTRQRLATSPKGAEVYSPSTRPTPSSITPPTSIDTASPSSAFRQIKNSTLVFLLPLQKMAPTATRPKPAPSRHSQQRSRPEQPSFAHVEQNRLNQARGQIRPKPTPATDRKHE